jgi:hypothetical protein
MISRRRSVERMVLEGLGLRWSAGRDYVAPVSCKFIVVIVQSRHGNNVTITILSTGASLKACAVLKVACWLDLGDKALQGMLTAPSRSANDDALTPSMSVSACRMVDADIKNKLLSSRSGH